MNVTTIPRVQSHVHLGVTVSSNLRWDQHVTAILEKVACYVNLSRTLAYRHQLPSGVVRKLYLSFIRPRFEYCSAVWCGASAGSLKRLEKVQLKVAKAIVRPHSVLSDSAILAASNLPTLSWRRREHCLCLMYQLFHGKGPPSLAELIPPAVQVRTAMALRTPHSTRFPSVTSSRHLSSFLCTTIPVWNSLPASAVSQCRNVSSFKSFLRCFFEADKFKFGL